jgi:uncharacterized membrane protein
MKYFKCLVLQIIGWQFNHIITFKTVMQAQKMIPSGRHR